MGKQCFVGNWKTQDCMLKLFVCCQLRAH